MSGGGPFVADPGATLDAPEVRYFEDVEVGTRELVGTYTASREEAVDFARTWEPQPYHTDEAAALRSPYAGLTLSSLYLFAICTRLFLRWEPRLAVLGMLGKDEIRLPAPARPGEELAYHTEWLAKRPSTTRPDRGIVTLGDTLSDPRGGVVLSQKVTLMVARRR
jgi:acyl dehydratase